MKNYKLYNRYFAFTVMIFILSLCFSFDLYAQNEEEETKTTPTTAEVLPPPAWEKTQIQIAVVSELAFHPTYDEVAIKMVGYHDEELLRNIALKIGEQFRATPSNYVLAKENADFEDDNSYQLRFNLPIVPRGQEYLPIEPFIVASAPYAKQVRIAYYIIGNFNYRGYRANYSDKQVDFAVDVPKTLGGVRSIYGIEANIKNKDLKELNLPKYPPIKNRTRLILALCIGAIIIALGVILAVFSSSKQEKEKKKENDTDEKN